MTWLSSIFYSLISGLAEVLPVSAPAHRLIMQSLLGDGKNHILLQTFLHMGSLAALFYSCHFQLQRLSRAQKLARVPKRSRKRPLDTRGLMDIRFIKMALIPVILAFFVYDRIAPMEGNLVAVSGFLFLNGLVLYIPQYLPGSNRDSGSLSRLDALLIGLAGALAVLPGFSCVGTAVSAASVRGAEKKFSLEMALLLSIAVAIGMVAMDILSIVATDLGNVTFMQILQYLMSGAFAFAGTTLGVRILRAVIDENELSVFSFYCWGMALFIFIFYLTAA